MVNRLDCRDRSSPLAACVSFECGRCAVGRIREGIVFGDMVYIELVLFKNSEDITLEVSIGDSAKSRCIWHQVSSHEDIVESGIDSGIIPVGF